LILSLQDNLLFKQGELVCNGRLHIYHGIVTTTSSLSDTEILKFSFVSEKNESLYLCQERCPSRCCLSHWTM